MEMFEADNGGRLEFDVRGDGPPLLLVHGSVFADPWGPMLSHANLLSDYQVVTYRRRGYGEGSNVEFGRTLSDEGADAVTLLDHLNIERAHVVGHSLAADIVLQAVVDSPHRFTTMTLLEAKLPDGAAEMALNDVPTLFGSDIPAGSGWILDEQAVRLLPHPTLLAVGSDTGPIFRESTITITITLDGVGTLTNLCR